MKNWVCGTEREKVIHSVGVSQTLIIDRTPIKTQILTQQIWVSNTFRWRWWSSQDVAGPYLLSRTGETFWVRSGFFRSIWRRSQLKWEKYTSSFQVYMHLELCDQRQAPSRACLPSEAADTFLASLLETSGRRLLLPGSLWPGWCPFKLHFADRESRLANGVVWSPLFTTS